MRHIHGNPAFPSHRRQRGAILIVALLLLLVLTVLGLAALGLSFTEERMAGNARNVNMAFQSAESGLRDAESWLDSLADRPDPCVDAPCQVYERAGMPGIDVASPDLRDMPDSWWDPAGGNGVEFGEDTGAEPLPGVALQPVYVIEAYTFVPDSLTVGQGPPAGRDFFKVTARGTGGVEAAQAVLESTYTRRF